MAVSIAETAEAQKLDRARRGRLVARVALAASVCFSFYLFAEFLLAGALSAGSDVTGSLLILAACLAPMAGLTWLALVTSGRLGLLVSTAAVLLAVASAALDFYALHLAPPDAQNAVVVGMVALAQFVIALVAGLAALIMRWKRRSAIRSATA